MTKRRKLVGAAALAAGALAGAALERAAFRRVMSRPDPERDEPIGSVPGRTSWTTSFDGTQLYTRTYGPHDAEATIVFAHGIVENHVIWHYVVRDLRLDGRFRLVAYDARGHGTSGPVRGPGGTTRFDGDTLARDLAAVVDQAAAGRVVVVGHSLGGMTALSKLVIEDIDHGRVAGGVIVNSTYTADFGGWWTAGRDATERVAEVFARITDQDPKRIERLRTGATDLAMLIARTIFGRDPSPRHIAVAFHMYETTPAQTLAAAIDLFRFDVADRLSAIDVPILVVAGSRDVITPSRLSEHMVDHIPGAESVVLEGCGHMAPFERYHEVTALIRKFADDHL